MCAVDDFDRLDAYRETRPKAAKPYRCVECYRNIPVGERYACATGVLDGEWHTYRLCQHCKAASEFMVLMCNGWPFGQLYEELVEHFRDGYASIPLARLIACMRRKWHDGTDPVPEHAGDLARDLMRQAVS